MLYKQIKVDFLLNKITKKDKLFKGDYTIDSFQNCEFGCLYCDSSYDEKIYIKTNAVEILNKELEKSKKGTIIIGSVHDPYQKAEEEFKITRDLLKIIAKQDFSCHILTKSNLIIRDIDIIKKINNCKVSISIISLKNIVSEIFEKNVPSPKTRLKTIEKLTDEGIIAGLAVIPVLPYITEEELEDIVKSAKTHRAFYLLHKYLELKGDQKMFFIKILKEFYPDIVEKYEKLFMESYIPDEKYILKIDNNIKKFCKNYKLKSRI